MKDYLLKSNLIISISDSEKKELGFSLLAAITAIVEEAGGEVHGQLKLVETKYAD